MFRQATTRRFNLEFRQTELSTGIFSGSAAVAVVAVVVVVVAVAAAAQELFLATTPPREA
jgi:hypothetical protein